ncbi:MAG: hypothetical protein IKS48_07375 [Eubacterium sp.]|nr:hypothetical protein [Methanobrevibacter sp.]MBR6403189.1 hypothetical protein [Eubacterium sp.]
MISERSLTDFYKNAIIPLCFYNLGTAESILNMKMYEIQKLKDCIGDHDIKELYYSMRGLTND